MLDDFYNNKILIVDDTEANRYILSTILAKEGFQVIEALTGKEALSKAQEKPDLILMDINLPDINGFDVCRKIKNSPDLKAIPILLLSVSSDYAKLFRNRLGGEAEGIILEPIEPSNLLATIQLILNLKKTEHELLLSEQRFRTVIECSSDAIITVDREWNIDIFNTAASKLTGVSTDHITGRSFFDTILLFDSKTHQLIKEFPGIKEKQVLEISNMILERPDGEKLPVALSVSPIEHEGGALVGSIISIRNIAVEVKMRQELEDMVKIRTAQLQASNKELEAFSYSVSHDLRAPLRSISGFSEILMERSKDRLDPESLHYLDRIRTAAGRMSDLIDALLSISVITRQEIRKKSVELTAMVQEIISLLKEQQPERKIVCKIQDGMTAHVDATLIRIVFENLLGNAFKFTSKKEEATIDVGWEIENSQKIFYIKDNGIGFDTRYSEKLFAPFQRLHKAEDFPGFGIGLATVKRIIMMHGGDIWVDSFPDQGTIFKFTLGPE